MYYCGEAALSGPGVHDGNIHIPTKSVVPSYFIAYLLFGLISGFLECSDYCTKTATNPPPGS